MTNLFGIPMEGLAISLAAILIIVLGVLGLLALRNRILLKLALRGIPRRPAQTVLIVVGLMLSTTIIAASLAIGDTVAGTIRGAVLDSLGQTDIRVRAPGGNQGLLGETYFGGETLQAVLDRADSDDRIDGALPQIRETLPVLDVDTQLTDARMQAVAVDVARAEGFGEITSVTGDDVTVSDLQAFEVYLNERAADRIEAEAGHELTVVTPTGRHSVIVKAVVREGGLASNDRRMLLRLEDMQRMLEREGEINRVDLSLRGEGEAGIGLSGEVVKDLRVAFTDRERASDLFDLLSSPLVIQAIQTRIDENPGGTITAGTKEKLETFVEELESGEMSDEFLSLAVDVAVSGQVAAALTGPGGSGSQSEMAEDLFNSIDIVFVDEIKKTNLDLAEFIGSIFVTIFTLFGSFSIIVGMLLIFLVFVMLAAARSTEMGIARAVGTKRRHLIQMFTFEGAAYALGASVVGTVVGFVAARFLVALLVNAVGTGDDGNSIDFKFTVTLNSIIAAFSIGMLLTLATVAISAYRVSKLNIVVAIRDLPPEFQPSETPPFLARLANVGKALLGPFYQGYRFVKLARRGEDATQPMLLFFANLFLFFIWIPVHVILRLILLISPYLRLGFPVMIIGLIVAVLGLPAESAFVWTLGVSIFFVGLGIFVKWLMYYRGSRKEIADRVGFTIMGVFTLAFWMLPFDALEWLTGELTGGIEMFILSGVWVVASSVWIIMYNADILIAAVQGTLGRIKALRPILKPAIAYPTTSRFRTGLTVAMFALVIFTMMVFAIVNNLGSSVGDDPDKATGGFDLRAETLAELPVTNIESEVQEAPNLDASQFEVIAAETTVFGEARQEDAEELRYLGIGVRGADETYLRNVNFQMTHFDPDYVPDGVDLTDKSAVARAIWDSLAEDPSLAVISAGRLAQPEGGFTFGPQGYVVEGVEIGDDPQIDSFDISLRQRGNVEGVAGRTVIGTVDLFAGQFESQENPFSGIYTRADIFSEISDTPVPFTTFRIKLEPGADAGRIAAAMQTAFLDNSMEVTDTVQEVRDGEAQTTAFNTLFQSFMGLGLVVGVASLGVLSFRAVVERRHSIGMMRAIGYRSRMIQVQFLIESVFVTVLGSVLGLVLGAWISYLVVDDIRESTENAAYSIPWATVGTILAIAVVASLVATFLPARQASKIYPSEALRYE